LAGSFYEPMMVENALIKEKSNENISTKKCGRSVYSRQRFRKDSDIKTL
jgi:hypothetical protein